MKYKVVIVKSNGTELELHLNKGWEVHQTVANAAMVLYILKKDEQKRR